MSDNIENKVLTLTAYHYENFPVASFLISHEIRKDIAIVYWFARTADDLADEGDVSADERINKLNDFENELRMALQNQSQNKYFMSLNQTIIKRNLTSQYFFDLLSAFKQDVVKKRYKDFNEILDYCRRSANPVGRIVLEINNIKDDGVNKLSDKICTALQLTNFYQDTSIDYHKGRIYYPVDEMQIFNVDENMFKLQKNNSQISQLVKYQVDRTQLYYNEGKKILDHLNGRLKLEIKWTISGGEKILSKIRKNNFDVFQKRPKLNKIDYIALLLKSIL